MTTNHCPGGQDAPSGTYCPHIQGSHGPKYRKRDSTKRQSFASNVLSLDKASASHSDSSTTLVLRQLPKECPLFLMEPQASHEGKPQSFQAFPGRSGVRGMTRCPGKHENLILSEYSFNISISQLLHELYLCSELFTVYLNFKSRSPVS